MKYKLHLIAILFAALTFGCRNSGGHLSLSTTDNDTNFKFEAKYAENKTAKLEKYLDSALDNELPLDQHIDLFVNLNGSDKFNLKAQKGSLSISFDKRNSSLAGYMQIKKLTEGIKKKLTE
ncbi:hypothetical protein G7074_06070 [Pedobacter sp. HDW13]|uniref:hypothetical protein n=1 Tax=unclassified Pedobacter TaxID=2628915 RepID=UPI000F59CFAC|nr:MULTISPECIES: hypothetical protein [unclassified Pedobacter]QIL38884.1 hypothetical protein G7074_06070 [Pedobacter sp. HDW13]RQO67211.1 hypothetical protein DBR40_20890 [Pedobacter sp. KBW01]